MKPYYERNGITIYCGECSAVMADVLQDASIDLTVTSPPYDNLRDYNGYTFEFEPIASGLWRVTKKGGVVVWVVADATKDFCETLTTPKQKIYFVEQCGFNLHDTMIYEKQNYPPAYPSLRRYASVFEYMLVLSKDKPKTFNPLKTNRAQRKIHLGNFLKPNGSFEKGPGFDKRKKEKKEKDNKEAVNIWSYSVGGGSRMHPAPFPEQLANDHIISWSNPGDTILDPMLGSGTTLKMAQQLGRRGIGIEISEDYCRIAVERLRQPSFFSIPDEPKAQPEQLKFE